MTLVTLGVFPFTARRGHRQMCAKRPSTKTWRSMIVIEAGKTVLHLCKIVPEVE